MFVNETITPSGIHIRFEAPDAEDKRAKRRYLLSHEGSDGWTDQIDGKGWIEVAGVTDVLNILDKPALPWWGMTTGVEGMLQLFNSGAIWPVSIPGRDRLLIACPHPETGEPVIAGKDEITYWLTKFQLTTNHQRDKGSDRGKAAHDAFELWCREGLKPEPSMFPDEERGYIVGLLGFIESVPFEPEEVEVMVASLEHEYAGRYDVRGRINTETRICHHIVDKSRNRSWAMLAPCSLMVDLKTSKGVYNSHSRQLEGYELASIESGYDPTDTRAILHVTEDGLWELKRSFARPESFLATLADWREEQYIETQRKAYGGARRKKETA